MTDKPQTVTLTLTKVEAEAISEALAHVYKNVFDRRPRGAGFYLRQALDKLNTITDARR